MTNEEKIATPTGDSGWWLDFVQSRQTSRSYQDRPIEPERLQRILESLRFAPSAHNRQPWRFVVMAESAKKESLAHIMGDRLRADRLADGDDAELIAQDVARSGKRITDAAVAILCCMTMEDMDTYPDDHRQTAEHWMAVQSAAMATQNMLLAAHAEGLGGCWMCAPLFCGDSLVEKLDLPDHWIPQALLTLGWPDKPPKKRQRLPIEEVVRFV